MHIFKRYPTGVFPSLLYFRFLQKRENEGEKKWILHVKMAIFTVLWFRCEKESDSFSRELHKDAIKKRDAGNMRIQ